MRAFRCNKCRTYEDGEAPMKFEYRIGKVSEEPRGALCGECEILFIKWLQEKPNANT